jgi:hypothetical protein
MKMQNDSRTKSSMQAELRCLLSSADNLPRLFSTCAALKGAEGANRLTAGRMGSLEDGFR